MQRRMFRLAALWSVLAISPAMKTDARPAQQAPAGQPVLPGPADEDVFTAMSVQPYCSVLRLHHPE